MAKGVKRATRGEKQFAPVINDDRFARLQTDPRFLRPNREEAKVVVDDRFKGLLTGGISDSKKKRIDKYGRKIGKKSLDREGEGLKRLYRLEEGDVPEASGSGSSSSSEEEEGATKGFIDYARGEGALESSDDDDSDNDSHGNDSESGSINDEEEDITIGNASARRKEKQRLRFEDEISDSEGADYSVDEEDADQLDVGKDDLARLDAQAERMVRREEAAARRAAESKPQRQGDTHRLAAVNMDWDHLRAVDLYRVFSSLVSPAGIENTSSVKMDPARKMKSNIQIAPIKGRVLNVRVYPSNFGIERMSRENIEGPPKDIFKRDEDGRVKTKKRSKKSKKGKGRDSNDSDDSEEELFGIDEGGEFDEEALRNYQLERLRYYYAIITFDSPETARYILDEVDGTEMERSANVFDLSFVPNDMTFPEEQAAKEDLLDEGWRDEANEKTEGGMYKGVDFTTDALRHSKVKLTWDADDPQRTKITRQVAQESLSIDELRDEDFKAYLATDSEGSDEEGEDQGGRSSMRALLGLGDEEGEGIEKDAPFGKTQSRAFEDGKKTRRRADEKGGEGKEMQITFMPGLSEAAERKRAGSSIEVKEESTRDQYLRKQREKKERRRVQGKGDDVAVERVASAPSEKLGFDDPFFASDNEADFEQALAAEANGKMKSREKSVNGKHAAEAAKTSLPESEKMNIEVIRQDDDDDDNDDTAGHFSIKDILKAEQEGGGKKSRWAKKKEKKKRIKEGEREQEVQENFIIDVQDERFQGVFNDHRFALDPSHPSFIKTKNMDKLLSERRKRDKQGRKQGSTKAAYKDSPEAELDNLIQSVKKRSSTASDGPVRKKTHR